MTITLVHYLVLAALLFVAGLVCMVAKRNAIGVLIGVELVLNSAGLNFAAFARYNKAFQLDGQVFTIFVIVLAAAEAAIALAIVLNFYNNASSIDISDAKELLG
ncbi:MAG TPA: NADH-quinone oxidoreductase subunit NuoK [Gemmatales bacterium]|nr:NADH-quinone oxidoreductase subunit NuoK [Gemmatales bacterium]